MNHVDIIIPLYNKENTIERTLRSIQEQTYTNWTVIVVDDGSTDNSPDRVRQLQDSRITLIQQSNKGPGAARNRGIEASRAPYIAFLDADDQWYPWYLENAVQAIENNPVSLVGSMYDEWPKQQDMTGYWKKHGVVPGLYELSGSKSSRLAEALMLFFHVGTTIIKAEAVRKFGGFYQANRCCYGEDTIFFARLVFNEPFMVIGPAAVRHNRQDSDLSHTQSHPLIPLLEDASILLDYCPEETKQLAQEALECHALRTAHHQARNGFKDTARWLLENFPEARRFKKQYYICQIEIFFSFLLPYLVRFKCLVGPPIRRCINQIRRQNYRNKSYVEKDSSR